MRVSRAQPRQISKKHLPVCVRTSPQFANYKCSDNAACGRLRRYNVRLTPRTLTAAQIRAFLPKMPFNQLLGIRLTKLHADGVTIECAVREELLNSARVVHGGVEATLADAAVGIALNRHFGAQRPITTVELKINYFRPVAKGKIYARAHLLRIGSTLCVGRADLADSEGNAVGTALVTYMLLDARAR
jgi:uncharacterized protein (TIGR00369 family)